MAGKTKLFGVSYDYLSLEGDEITALKHSWESIRTLYNANGDPFKYLDDTDFEFFKMAIQIMKNHYKGQEFVGLDPDEGQFGIRLPQVEDLVGDVDTEWGATTNGTGSWTAGQREWIGTTAQNSTTFALAAEIRLRNNTSGQEWAFLMFGVQSMSVTPVVKDVLVSVGGAQMAIQQIEHQMRASGLHLAKFDGPFFFHPTRSFKMGVTVRTSAQDQVRPLGVIILQGIRAKDLSINRPDAA